MNHRTHSFLISICLLLVAGAALNSCRPASVSQAPSSTAAGPLTLVDALGREVTLPALPQRIAIAGKSAMLVAGAVYMFPEASERVVALVRTRQNVGNFVALLDPGYDQKTLLEVDAGPEQIAAARPDVVILKSTMAESLGRPLEEIGIPSVTVDLETPEQYRRDLIMLGRLLGNEARAEAIWAFYQSRLDRVADALKGAEEVRVLLLQHSNQEGDVALEVPAAGWIQTIEVELAGGIPVWKEAAQGGGWQVVNLEQIAAWDSDQVFVVSYQEDPAVVAAGLRASPQWAALRATKTGEIWGFPGDLYNWAQSDPRWILGLTWLATRIHPDRLAQVDVRQEMVDFFQQVYGMEKEVIEAQILPHLQGDVR